MKNSPELWADLLAQSPPGSVLMGGAIVDYIQDVIPNDYDIFHTYKPQPMFVPKNWKLTDQDFNNPDWVDVHEEQYLQGVDDHGNHPVGSINEYLVDDKYKVQLIGVQYADPKFHFRNFDHSLTLARFSKNGLWVNNKVFESINMQMIEYVSKNKNPAAVARSRARAQNKADKYGWKHPIFVGFPADIPPAPAPIAADPFWEDHN